MNKNEQRKAKGYLLLAAQKAKREEYHPVDMAVLKVDFIELQPETYQGMSINIKGDRKNRHKGSGFYEHGFSIEGWNASEAWLAFTVLLVLLDIDVICSSSVDHYIMDGGIIEGMD